LSVFAAFLAAIMLVIVGAPARAAVSPCDPCPPDCPMMQQMAAATPDHHGQAHDKGGQAENPCKQGLACQGSAAPVVAPSGALAAVVLTTEAVDHRLAVALAAPSRPPDRSLRPPIQL
jgi:hypothetical protein